MTADALALARAMFPDAVEFRFVDSLTHRLWMFPADLETEEECLPISSREGEMEDVRLQPITEAEDVWAGMSEKTHIVFVFVDRGAVSG